jgi:hypothetical protein
VIVGLDYQVTPGTKLKSFIQLLRDEVHPFRKKNLKKSLSFVLHVYVMITVLGFGGVLIFICYVFLCFFMKGCPVLNEDTLPSDVLICQFLKSILLMTPLQTHKEFNEIPTYNLNTVLGN